MTSAVTLGPDHPMTHFADEWSRTLFAGLAEQGEHEIDAEQILAYGAGQMLAMCVADPAYAARLFLQTFPMDDQPAMLDGAEEFVTRHPIPAVA